MTTSYFMTGNDYCSEFMRLDAAVEWVGLTCYKYACSCPKVIVLERMQNRRTCSYPIEQIRRPIFAHTSFHFKSCFSGTSGQVSCCRSSHSVRCFEERWNCVLWLVRPWGCVVLPCVAGVFLDPHDKVSPDLNRADNPKWLHYPMHDMP
jgi:hypothetical protein